VSKTNPADPFVTIACSHPADPAIDWSKPNAQEAVLEHQRRRTSETLGKIPVKSGEALTLVTLRALTHAEVRHVERLRTLATTSAFDVHELAAGMAIESLQRGGMKIEVAHREDRGLCVATEEASTKLWDELGMQALEELGSLVLQRARLRDAGPFALPAGVVLGRPPR
jgi:hypothetical protein